LQVFNVTLRRIFASFNADLKNELLWRDIYYKCVCLIIARDTLGDFFHKNCCKTKPGR
jgi:hypothetical protein